MRISERADTWIGLEVPTLPRRPFLPIKSIRLLSLLIRSPICVRRSRMEGMLIEPEQGTMSTRSDDRQIERHSASGREKVDSLDERISPLTCSAASIRFPS